MPDGAVGRVAMSTRYDSWRPDVERERWSGRRWRRNAAKVLAVRQRSVRLSMTTSFRHPPRPSPRRKLVPLRLGGMKSILHPAGRSPRREVCASAG